MTEPASPQRISLIIPLYNSEAFIHSALASVAGQTLLPDEVVVVDDASTDGGAAVVEKWAGMLPLKLVRHQVNRGLGAARCTGIDASSGELITLLDADDILFPDHLESMMTTFREVGGVVTADTLWWSPGTSVSTVPGRVRKKVPPPDKQLPAILDHNFVHPISVFRREDYVRAGGFSELRRMEDWDLWIRMVRAGVTITMCPTVTALYRVHGRSLSAGRGNLETNVEVLGEMISQTDDATERRILERTLRRRRARQKLLMGERLHAEGRTASAVSTWLRAAAEDRRLTGGLTGGRSSVTLQAIANVATLGRVGRVRRSWSSDGRTGLRQR